MNINQQQQKEIGLCINLYVKTLFEIKKKQQHKHTTTSYKRKSIYIQIMYTE